MSMQPIPPGAVCVYCSRNVHENDGTMLWGIPIHIECMVQVNKDLEEMEGLFDPIEDPFEDETL